MYYLHTSSSDVMIIKTEITVLTHSSSKLKSKYHIVTKRFFQSALVQCWHSTQVQWWHSRLFQSLVVQLSVPVSGGTAVCSSQWWYSCLFQSVVEQLSVPVIGGTAGCSSQWWNSCLFQSLVEQLSVPVIGGTDGCSIFRLSVY